MKLKGSGPSFHVVLKVDDSTAPGCIQALKSVGRKTGLQVRCFLRAGNGFGQGGARSRNVWKILPFVNLLSQLPLGTFVWFHGAFSKIRSLVASSRIQIQRSWLVLHRGYAQHLDHTAVRVVPSAEAFRWDDLYELDYYASRVKEVHALLKCFSWMPPVAKQLIAEFAISGAEMSLQSVAAQLTQGTSWRRIYKGPEPGHPLALRVPLLQVSWSPTSDKTIAREIELRNNVHCPRVSQLPWRHLYSWSPSR